jgi:hypothetical protein
LSAFGNNNDLITQIRLGGRGERDKQREGEQEEENRKKEGEKRQRQEQKEGERREKERRWKKDGLPEGTKVRSGKRKSRGVARRGTPSRLSDVVGVGRRRMEMIKIDPLKGRCQWGVSSPA